MQISSGAGRGQFSYEKGMALGMSSPGFCVRMCYADVPASRPQTCR
jgi:hypothetical protein